MIDPTARCPKWLIGHMIERGGSISFYEYMDLVLNDPGNGFYSTGRLKIGKDGDFCTSPSLSNDFARLLAVQVAEWFLNLEKGRIDTDLFSLVEIGPGEGSLSRDLIDAIYEIAPALISKIELVLVELNVGMRERQEKVVENIKGVNCRWSNLDELSLKPVTGVIIANEVLDAFPVERLVFRDKKVFRQGVSLRKIDDKYFLSFVDLKITTAISQFLNDSKSLLKVEFPPKDICNEWVTEWHCDVPIWFRKLSKVLINGSLLVVDYALESKRYYNAMRKSGTLISYKNQEANTNLLKDAGFCDLTAHLCIESTVYYAITNGWKFMGEARQGQALLALGLSKFLYSLQNMNNNDLSTVLDRRESLLRLVDPMGLGEFRWLAFQKGNSKDLILRNRFLEEPIS
ncbi:SAM-dependent methyltransferase [Prochlorococcus marinus XMU1408]|uniref:SAM-dependent methyltransferase n=2 Tax=Prochlorococcus marinus TaxID=1219 RepID=A0A318R210_PROMR|nr:SAM-dependent methyltransferase [Prochlorococcus marinus str. XMU1408]PYE03276.1 SAM-dependent methyltransferase [Prochlorococcus marinus XMU1408]